MDERMLKSIKPNKPRGIRHASLEGFKPSSPGELPPTDALFSAWLFHERKGGKKPCKPCQVEQEGKMPRPLVFSITLFTVIPSHFPFDVKPMDIEWFGFFCVGFSICLILCSIVPTVPAHRPIRIMYSIECLPDLCLH